MAIKGNAYTARMTFAAGTGARTTTSQYKVAYLSASMTVCVASASSDRVIGIIDSYQSSGSTMVTVITHGVATGCMLSGTTCTLGDWLVATTAGSLVVALTNTTANQRIVGQLLDVPASGGAATVYVCPMPGGTLV